MIIFRNYSFPPIFLINFARFDKRSLPILRWLHDWFNGCREECIIDALRP